MYTYIQYCSLIKNVTRICCLLNNYLRHLDVSRHRQEQSTSPVICLWVTDLLGYVFDKLASWMLLARPPWVRIARFKDKLQLHITGTYTYILYMVAHMAGPSPTRCTSAFFAGYNASIQTDHCQRTLSYAFLPQTILLYCICTIVQLIRQYSHTTKFLIQ